MTAPDSAHRAIEAVFRIESARLIAGLARIVRDVGLAEELAQDALLAALQAWPRSGIPDKPGAWLMATAKHRAIDLLRRRSLQERKFEELARTQRARQAAAEPGLEAALDDDIGDDLLRLMFAACHPLLSTEARVALTLRLLGGLTTAELARAFLVSEATVAQRIVRAKRTLADAGVPFEIPRGPSSPRGCPRCSRSSTSSSTRAMRPRRATTGCGPRCATRRCAWGASWPGSRPRRPRSTAWSRSWRSRPRGWARGPAPRESPCCCWTRIARAGTRSSSVAASRRWSEPSGSAAWAAPMPCRRPSPPATRGRPARLRRTGRASLRCTPRWCIAPSPVVELNRAVAVAMAFGPAAGLELVDALGSEPSLRSYHLLPSVRGDLLARLGRCDEARSEFARAAGLTRNARERALLLARAAACAPGPPPPTPTGG